MIRKGQSSIAILFCLLMTGSLVSSMLSVYNLQALEETDTALLDIPYSIANYGFAPYDLLRCRFGKTIIGKLVHSPSFGDECSLELDPNIDYGISVFYSENSFLLIPRGKCEFVTKTLNAQRLGAQMAIIVDDQDHKNTVIMADNGYGKHFMIQVTRSIFPQFSSTMKQARS